MTYQIEIKNIPDFPSSILPVVHEEMKKAMFMAEATSKRDYLSGPRPEKLGVVTGRLRSSIKGTAHLKFGNTEGRLGTNVPYGPTHELGLTVRGYTFRKRPFLVPAIEDNLNQFQLMFADAILGALSK